MALELGDVQTFEGSIANGATEEIEVKTATADYVTVILDDGTTGNSPSEYTVEQQYYIPSFDDYMQFSEQTTQTASSLNTSARGARLKYRFTNTSGASDTYRIVVQTFKEI
jgi:hypothetical protein